MLTLLHARPGYPWTLDELAREAASSRSNVAQRFTELVGQPPMQYLAQWRMQVAANRLTGSTDKLAAIAAEVGYESRRASHLAHGARHGAWARRVKGCQTTREQEVGTFDHWRGGAGAAV